MLTIDKINLNYLNFITKLEKYDIYPQEMKDDVEFNEKLKNASAFTNEETGGAYEGSLVEHIIRIAVLAYGINKSLYEEVQVDVTSLIKVCYLHQISKALMIKKNHTDWEVKKGKLFTFESSLPAIKCGEYSIFISNKYGIKLTEEEYEAILSVDKKDDEQTKYFGSQLSQVLRSSIDLATIERKQRFKHYTKK